ncbi:MAG: LPXTG cell wall anchor domain-containing protein [Blautia sp.]|nr:LPXTG cell wall anchor domain-containing protein [Blautia sp.]
MKKRLAVVICSLMMVFGMTQSVMAKVSPTGTKITTETTDKTETAPKTGESSTAAWALGAGLLLTGGAVISRKHFENA